MADKSLRTRTFIVLPNEPLEFASDGDYLRVRQSSVTLYVENDEGDRVEMSEGDDVSQWPFKRLRVSHDSGIDQTVKLTIGKGITNSSAKVGGSVQLAGQQGPFTQGRASVTNANQALIAANAARKFLMVQNNDLAQVLRVTLDGIAAGAGAGFRIEPGESLDLSGFLPTGAVNVCMEAATGAANNVEFCEG